MYTLCIRLTTPILECKSVFGLTTSVHVTFDTSLSAFLMQFISNGSAGNV